MKLSKQLLLVRMYTIDKLRQTILKTAAPAGIKVVFFNPEKFISAYHKVPIKRRTMLLFTNPKEVFECLDGKVKFDYLNVGQHEQDKF